MSLMLFFGLPLAAATEEAPMQALLGRIHHTHGPVHAMNRTELEAELYRCPKTKMADGRLTSITQPTSPPTPAHPSAYDGALLEAVKRGQHEHRAVARGIESNRRYGRLILGKRFHWKML